MAKIVITEFMTENAVDDLARADEVIDETDLFERPGDLASLAVDAEGLIDAALADAIRAGHLGGAALDVPAVEPPNGESGPRFRGLDNLILTPQIAGPTTQPDICVSGVTADNVSRILSSPT